MPRPRTPLDTYAVHAPTKSGRPRRLHPKQLPELPTAEALRPHASHYIAPALDSIRQALQHDPASTSARYMLPNRKNEAPAVRQLIAEHLHALGAQVGPLQRTRGTRQPFAVITWPAGWTVPENPTEKRATNGAISC